LPDSEFTHYYFERSICLLGGPDVELIVGWYW